MNWTVLVRPRAEADLEEAWRHYETEVSGLGDEFLSEMRGLILSLTSQPQRMPIYYRGFRRLLGVRFPYKVFYRVIGTRVIVFRVLHAKQDHRRQLRPSDRVL